MENYPEVKPVHDFDSVKNMEIGQRKVEAMKSAARGFHEKLMSKPAVRFFQSFPLVRVPYPTKYGFRDAYSGISPYLHIINRLFVVQFEANEKIKTLLMSPSDIYADEETPFFKMLNNSLGPFKNTLRPILSPVYQTVEQALEKIGISPEQVDYISYDHLHTQDIRKWLGSENKKPYFPNAKLLVMKKEWEFAKDLTPNQKNWYCPDGIKGVDESKVVQLEGDVMLGESVALLETPGHTIGNHSFATRVDKGVFVTSENGVSPESYAPEHSKVPGLKRFHKNYQMEVVLNGNTLDGSSEQYISMIKEKYVAGPSIFDKRFPNLFCSSQLEGYWLFPTTRPGFSVPDKAYGEIYLGEKA